MPTDEEQLARLLEELAEERKPSEGIQIPDWAQSSDLGMDRWKEKDQNSTTDTRSTRPIRSHPNDPSNSNDLNN